MQAHLQGAVEASKLHGNSSPAPVAAGVQSAAPQKIVDLDQVSLPGVGGSEPADVPARKAAAPGFKNFLQKIKTRVLVLTVTVSAFFSPKKAFSMLCHFDLAAAPKHALALKLLNRHPGAISHIGALRLEDKAEHTLLEGYARTNPKEIFLNFVHYGAGAFQPGSLRKAFV